MQVWSESSDGSGVVNFLTGMGGFLQAVLFGYTGFRRVPIRTSIHVHTNTHTYRILINGNANTLHVDVACTHPIKPLILSRVSC